jgi:hypothetical protein
MRRSEQLISISRKLSGSANFSATTGIQDEEFLEWLTEAHRYLHASAVNKYSKAFTITEIKQVTSQIAELNIPSDVFMQAILDKVEYSVSGRSDEYYQLNRLNTQMRDDYGSGNPAYYIQVGSQIILQPKPQSAGYIRFSYVKKFPRIDKRRATVSAVTLATDTITSLEFDTTVDLDETNINAEGAICIVNKYGAIKMRGILGTVNATSGVFTVDSDFVFQTGETISVGDYAVLGTNSTTHSGLPDDAENYLIKYMVWQAQKRKSSDDAAEAEADCMNWMASLVELYATNDHDVLYVPIVSSEYFRED